MSIKGWKAMYEDCICEACGFTSQEERGVYNCPVCGTQMKVHREERRGGLTNSSGKLLIYFLECVIILPNMFSIPKCIWNNNIYYYSTVNKKILE